MITDKSTTKPVHAHGLTAATRDIGTLINRAIAAEVENRDTAIGEALRPLADRLGSEIAAREALERRIFALEHPPIAPPPIILSPPLLVASVPDLLSAIVDDVPHIMLRNGIHPIRPAAEQAANSLWIGASSAARENPLYIRAETPGGVTFDLGGASGGGWSWQGGAQHQTWDSILRFVNGSPGETGVLMFGGYAGQPGGHHLTLLNVDVGEMGNPADPHGHAAYFSWSVGGVHDILIDGYVVHNSRRGMKSGLHFFHSDPANVNAWNVTIRHMGIDGAAESGIYIWDPTLHDILIEDSTVRNANHNAVRYEMPGERITLRRLVSTGSGQAGFHSDLGPNPPGVTIEPTCDLR